MKKNTLFNGISNDDLQKLLQCFSSYKKTFDKDSYIFHSGDKIHEIGLIVSGGVNIIKEDFWISNIKSSPISMPEYLISLSSVFFMGWLHQNLVVIKETLFFLF